LGLAPVAVDVVYESLAVLTASGATIILVEQDLGRAMGFADRVVCMLEGRIALEGAAGDLTRDEVTEAYFGLSGAQHAVRGDGGVKTTALNGGDA
jgi:branched-chain amino acid transport system ATP-binding protein